MDRRITHDARSRDRRHRSRRLRTMLLACFVGWLGGLGGLGGLGAGRAADSRDAGIAGAIGGTERAPGVVLPDLSAELLEIEARCRPVTPAAGRCAAEVVGEACARIRASSRPTTGVWSRRQALAVFECVDAVLLERGFVYPASGAVDLWVDTLTPFTMRAEDRAAFEAKPQNRRRLQVIAARFPGPFQAVDCDTGSYLYLAVAERLGLPWRMVFVPSRDRRPSHAFVRWQAGAHRLDWETTEGRERVEDGRIGDGRGRPRTDARPAVELELTRRNVLGCEHYLAAVAWEHAANRGEARRELEAALADFPGHWDARRQLAWHLATDPDLGPREREAALTHARRVVERFDDADARDTLAAAYAANGRFDRAVREERTALADPVASAAARAEYRARLANYERGRSAR